MKKGFTLIETVIVIGITLIALAALVNLFLIFNSIFGYQQAYMKTAGAAGSALAAFEAAVLPAAQVLASHDFSGTIYSSAATVLVLELPSVDSSGGIISNTKDYIVFYTSSGTLYELTEVGTGSVRMSGNKQLCTTVSSLAFTYDNVDFTQVTSVIVDLQAQTQYKQLTAQGHVREQLYLRNSPTAL